jgi:IS30 family transposase
MKDADAGVREIARALGRSPSSISRELHRNVSRAPRRYRALPAHLMARERGRRPKPCRLAAGTPVRAEVARMLRAGYSPREIEGRLRLEHPDDRGMQVSHETIYRAPFVQGKGSLRAEIGRPLRCGHRRRRPRGGGDPAKRGLIPGIVSISGRPAGAAGRAVPGHREGDLIIGKGCRSAVGTLVERTTRYVLLLHLPGGRDAHLAGQAMREATGTLPAELARTITWDQGIEMARHAGFTLATGIPACFCDPHSPWQRGSNENTSGLLRQYLPKGTDLSVHSAGDLARIAASLNGRPRKTLEFMTPSEKLTELLAHTG